MRAKIPTGRRIAAVCILMAFFVFFAFDLVKLQLVEGEEYNAVISSVAGSYHAFFLSPRSSFARESTVMPAS